MTPMLSKLGVPDSTVLMLSECPLHGLGLYDDLEICEQYSFMCGPIGLRRLSSQHTLILRCRQ